MLTTPPTTPNTAAIDLTDNALGVRTFKFFAYLTEHAPLLKDIPGLPQIMRRIMPHMLKRIQVMNQDELEVMFRAMLVSLAQVYEPNATVVEVHLKTGELFAITTEVAEVLEREPISNLDELLAQIPDVAPVMPAEAPLFPPQPAKDEEPVVGVELPDGTVVRMLQSEYLAMQAAAREAAQQ